MYDKVLHNRWSKLATAVAGAVLMAVAINLFIVPQGLYTGGLLGLCQVIRTLLVTKLGVMANFDIAGLIYLASNVPLLLLAYKTLGRTFVLRLTICTVVNSLSMSIIPVPAQPIIPDLLTSCMVGGILVGFSSGLMLTCGGSSGGMDILGLYLSKKGTGFTVGKFSLLFNAMLYTLCMLLFNAQTAIYSAIYTVFSSLFVDRVHQQNITVQVTIMTKVMDIKPFQAILHRLDRGLTRWTGQGAYTGEPVQVLCICVSKYELESIRSTPPRSSSCRRASARAGISRRIYRNFVKKGRRPFLAKGIRSEPRIFACCAQSVFCDVHAAAKYGFDFIRAGRGAHSARHGKAPPAVGWRGFPFMRGRSRRPSGRRLRRGRCRSGAGARRARR